MIKNKKNYINKEKERIVLCKSCGETWDINQSVVCPKCGKSEKLTKVNLQGHLTFIGSLNRKWRQEYYKKNKCTRNINIIIAFLFPFLGYFFFSRIVGLIVGLALGVLNYILSPYVITKISNKEWDAK